MTAPTEGAMRADIETIIMIDVNACARCGGDHKNQVFQQFTRPCGEYTHFGYCPQNKEPIILKQCPKPTPTAP